MKIDDIMPSIETKAFSLGKASFTLLPIDDIRNAKGNYMYE